MEVTLSSGQTTTLLKTAQKCPMHQEMSLILETNQPIPPMVTAQCKCTITTRDKLCLQSIIGVKVCTPTWVSVTSRRAILTGLLQAMLAALNPCVCEYSCI